MIVNSRIFRPFNPDFVRYTKMGLRASCEVTNFRKNKSDIEYVLIKKYKADTIALEEQLSLARETLRTAESAIRSAYGFVESKDSVGITFEELKSTLEIVKRARQQLGKKP